MKKGWKIVRWINWWIRLGQLNGSQCCEIDAIRLKILHRDTWRWRWCRWWRWRWWRRRGPSRASTRVGINEQSSSFTLLLTLTHFTRPFLIIYLQVYRYLNSISVPARPVTSSMKHNVPFTFASPHRLVVWLCLADAAEKRQDKTLGNKRASISPFTSKKGIQKKNEHWGGRGLGLGGINGWIKLIQRGWHCIRLELICRRMYSTECIPYSLQETEFLGKRLKWNELNIMKWEKRKMGNEISVLTTELVSKKRKMKRNWREIEEREKERHTHAHAHTSNMQIFWFRRKFNFLFFFFVSCYTENIAN